MLLSCTHSRAREAFTWMLVDRYGVTSYFHLPVDQLFLWRFTSRILRFFLFFMLVFLLLILQNMSCILHLLTDIRPYCFTKLQSLKLTRSIQRNCQLVKSFFSFANLILSQHKIKADYKIWKVLCNSLNRRYIFI